MSLASVRRRAAPAVKTALLRSGFYATLRSIRPSRDLGILRYHAICGSEGHSYADPSICTAREAFERHVRHLAANYRVLALPEAVAALRDRKTLPTNSVAVTFDDGYADNLWAARLLARHGLTATFFIAAGCVGGEQPFWPAEIRAILAGIARRTLRLRVNGCPVELSLRDAGERQAAVACLTRLIKSSSIPVRERLREELRQQAGRPVIATPMLTWDQLTEMQACGMTIGAHTLTHPNLPSAGLADATHEIVGSKRRLERELGIEVTMFSYPNGGADRYYTPELQQVVADAGFRAAACSRNGFASSDSDWYALERIQVADRLEDLLFALEMERFAFKPRQRTTC